MSDFLGIDAADLAEVRALNKAFLRAFRRQDDAVRRDHLAVDVVAKMTHLTDWEIERLARIPVLLGISVTDAAYWDAWFDRDAQPSLFSTAATVTPTTEVTVATLLFLWQTARANPYVARLLSGASVSWCERLAGCRLTWLVRRAHARPDFLSPRHAAHQHFWLRLLRDGVNEDREIRHAAHLCALQTALTVAEEIPVDRFRTAACRAHVPVFQVAEPD
ncbi:MAG: hypothetical protein AAF351_02605 [Pseudomonadota bacterium]